MNERDKFMNLLDSYRRKMNSSFLKYNFIIELFNTFGNNLRIKFTIIEKRKKNILYTKKLIKKNIPSKILNQLYFLLSEKFSYDIHYLLIYTIANCSTIFNGLIIDLEGYNVICIPFSKFLISRYSTIKKYDIDDLKKEFKIFKLPDGFFVNVYYDKDRWKIQGFNNIDVSNQYFFETSTSDCCETTFYSFLLKYYPISKLNINYTYSFIFINTNYNFYSKYNEIILFGVQDNNSLLPNQIKETSLESVQSLVNFDISNMGFILKNIYDRENRILYLNLFHQMKKMVYNKLKRKEYNIKKIILVNILKYDISLENLNYKHAEIYEKIRQKIHASSSSPSTNNFWNNKFYNYLYDKIFGAYLPPSAS